MTKVEAKKILKNSHNIFYKNESNTEIALDSFFNTEELEAIIFLMKTEREDISWC